MNEAMSKMPFASLRTHKMFAEALDAEREACAKTAGKYVYDLDYDEEYRDGVMAAIRNQ
jgi:hypothetical protein